jgi:hypothetical protein
MATNQITEIDIIRRVAELNQRYFDNRSQNSLLIETSGMFATIELSMPQQGISPVIVQGTFGAALIRLNTLEHGFQIGGLLAAEGANPQASIAAHKATEHQNRFIQEKLYA